MKAQRKIKQRMENLFGEKAFVFYIMVKLQKHGAHTLKT